MHYTKIRSTLAIVLCLFSVSCIRDTSTTIVGENISLVDSNTISIDIQIFPNKILDISKSMDSISVIPLAIDEHYIIGQVSKIIEINDRLFILDRHSSKSLFCFNKLGEYLSTVGNVGQGPGEYVEPTDFTIQDSTIIVLDQFQRKLLYYTLNGEYITERRHPYIIHEIAHLPHSSILVGKCGTNQHIDSIQNYELIYIAANGDILEKKIFNKTPMNYTSGYRLKENGEQLYYSKAIDNKVYKLSPNNVSIEYLLNISENNSHLPENYESVCKGDFEQFMRKFEGSYPYFGGSIFQNDRYLYLNTISKERQTIWTVYDKRKKESISGRIEVCFNQGEVDLRSFLFCMSASFYEAADNAIIGVVYSHEIPQSLNLSNYTQSKVPISESGNPVIFKFYPKN